MSLQDQIIDNLNFARDRRNCKPAEAPVLYVDNEDGSQDEVQLPVKWVVCHVCNGAGTHVHPGIDCNGLSAEDFADPDFEEEYRSGRYDVNCNACGGRTTVQEVDWDRLTPGQRMAYERQLDADSAYDAERMAEIRCGA